MTITKSYNVETDDARFDVKITKENDSDVYVAEYYGTAPKFAKIMNPGDELPLIREVGSGKLEGSEIEALLQDCIKEIEENHGEVISSRES